MLAGSTRRVRSTEGVRARLRRAASRWALSRTSITAELIGDPGDLSRLKGVADVSVDGHTLRAQVDADSLGQVIKALGDAGVRTLISQPPTLEELFLRHYDISADTTAETSEGVPA